MKKVDVREEERLGLPLNSELPNPLPPECYFQKSLHGPGPQGFAKKLIKILSLQRPTSSPMLWAVPPRFGSAPLFISIIKVEGRRGHKSKEKYAKYSMGAPWPESQRVTTSHNES